MQLLGSKLEIRPLQNPFLLAKGENLDVRILFKGEPLADKLVWAHNIAGAQPVSTLKVSTNANGVARFVLGREGPWQIRLVHLAPCLQWENVDWESYWTSYTFELD